VLLQVAEPQPRHAGLARPEQLAGAAQRQVLLGDHEARRGSRPSRRAGAAHPRRSRPGSAARSATAAAAADPAAQLVELRQPEALGVLDHHHRRRRDVDADPITVVATSTSSSPVLNAARITRSRPAPSEPAVDQADAHARAAPRRRRPRRWSRPSSPPAVVVAGPRRVNRARSWETPGRPLAGADPLGDQLVGRRRAARTPTARGSWPGSGRAASRRAPTRRDRRTR